MKEMLVLLETVEGTDGICSTDPIAVCEKEKLPELQQKMKDLIEADEHNIISRNGVDAFDSHYFRSGNPGEHLFLEYNITIVPVI